MDIWRLMCNIFLTVSLICIGPVKLFCLGFKTIQNYHFNSLNALRAAQSVSLSAQCAFKIYGGSFCIYIMKVGCVAQGVYMIK
jgi:hypothetical protein